MLGIFKDRNRLSPRYMPTFLPHREEQLHALTNLFEDTLDRISETYLRTVQIIGGVGVGKTSTALRFGASFQEKARARKIDLVHVYINLKLQSSGRVVLYRHLLEQGAPEIRATSLSADEMLYQLVKYLTSRGKYLLLTLDEIEYYLRQTKDRIIYELTRINELAPENPCGIIGIIFISRDKSFHTLLDASELSSLGRTTLEFPPYNVKQIHDILEDRVSEAFRRGTVSEDVLDYIADIAAKPPVNSDIRYALDLLLYAGNLAEEHGADKVLPEHVRKIHGEIYHQITSGDILELPDDERLVLLGLARALRNRKTPYVAYKEVQECSDLVAEEHGTRIRGVDHLLQDLGDRGIVQIKSLTQIGIADIPTEGLIEYLNSLLERVETDFKGREK
ncbi:AAA family ATPase [Candidatus Bathyarchaeota archaeon]|nr:AAA family ATPase [Candidatus Bathyarchaeota archaeon]